MDLGISSPEIAAESRKFGAGGRCPFFAAQVAFKFISFGDLDATFELRGHIGGALPSILSRI